MYNILIINIGSHYGGVEKHIENTLEELNNEAFNIHILCRYESRFALEMKKKINNNLSIITISPRKLLNEIFYLKKYLKEKHINIIHSHGISSNLIAYLIKNRNTNLINTIHGYADFDRMNRPILEQKFYLGLEKFLLKRNDICIAVSEDIKRNLILKGVEIKKIKTIHHGIKADLNIDVEKKKEENILRIGSLGRLEFVKGYDILIQSIKHCVDNKYTNIKCEICGDGIEYNELKNLIDVLKLEKYIELKGFIEDKSQFLNSLNIYIQPSRIESFGLAIAEAMSVGLPVIATASGGIPEIIDSRYNGVLVKPNDYVELANAIMLLVDNKNLRKEISNNAQKTISEKFTLSKKVREYEALLMSL